MADTDLTKIKEPPPKTDDDLAKKFKEEFDETHVTSKAFADHKKEFEFHKGIQNWTFVFIIAILLICFLTFIAYVVDAWKLHADRQKEYMQTVKELKQDNDSKMNALIQSEKQFADSMLRQSKRIEYLEKKLGKK